MKAKFQTNFAFLFLQASHYDNPIAALILHIEIIKLPYPQAIIYGTTLNYLWWWLTSYLRPVAKITKVESYIVTVEFENFY